MNSSRVVLVQEYFLRIDSFVFEITPECTYMDWFLCAVPFVVRKAFVLQNAWRIMFLFFVVMLFNIARICLAIFMNLKGGDWFWVHDFMDYLLWYPSLFVVIFLWWRYTYKQLQKRNA